MVAASCISEMQEECLGAYALYELEIEQRIHGLYFMSKPGCLERAPAGH